MEDYKQIIKHGGSDIASVSVRYCDMNGDLQYSTIKFSGDGRYNFYLNKDLCTIPNHYKKILDINCCWFDLIDDEGVVIHEFVKEGKFVSFYQAGYSILINISEGGL